MQTLDELCTFLGFPVGAMAVARFGGPPEPDLELAGQMVKGFGDQTPTSLDGLIRAVQNLPALTLEALLLSDRRGEDPYELRVRLSPSPGIVWRTKVEYVLNGNDARGGDKNFGAGDVHPVDLGPGFWEIFAIREGIGSFGLTVLRQSLGRVVVTRSPQPSPVAPEPPAVVPPPAPLVTCQIEIDGENPGFGGITNYVVSGGGFEADEDVDLFEGRDLAQTSRSDTFGRFSMKISILHARPPVEHVFFARGQRSKRESWKAGRTV